MSFDEMYDQMLRDEFRSRAASRPKHARPGSKGMARYRSAALVGAGGVACAAVGAFLGGLGGYFTLSPAGAHSVTSSSQDVPYAAPSAPVSDTHAVLASTPAGGAGATSGTTAGGAAEEVLATVAGPLLHGITPLPAPTADLPVSSPVTGAPITYTPPGGGSGTGGPGSGSGSGGSGSDGSGQRVGLDLGDILGSLQAALADLGPLPADPSAALSGLVPPLAGVVSDLTGTLTNLGALLPVPSGLPAGATGAGGSGPGGLPVVSAASPSADGTSSRGGVSPTVRGLTPVLQGVAAAAAGSSGPTVPSIPSLPLPGPSGTAPTVPSLPVTTPSGSLPAPPSVSVPTVSSTNGSTTVNVPTPVGSVGASVGSGGTTISVGGISVGLNTSGSGSPLTLNLG